MIVRKPNTRKKPTVGSRKCLNDKILNVEHDIYVSRKHARRNRSPDFKIRLKMIESFEKVIKVKRIE